jgi:hypothetical protein
LTLQPFALPAWVWINLILLVVAAIFVAVKLAAAERARQHRLESKPLAAGRGRAVE